MEFDLKKMYDLLIQETTALLGQDFGYSNVRHESRYTFIDNGSNILAVCHLDTVKDLYFPKVDTVGKSSKKIVHDEFADPLIETGRFYTRIQSVCLDDRLGLFYILYVLPLYGIRVDILLTTDEETGASSASEFVTEKKYNWMFQFDRHGYGGAVLYQYENNVLRAMLQNLDIVVETGTYSDIASLEHLGCRGINFCVGYKNEHTDACFTRTDWMQLCVSMFADFFFAYEDVKLDYVPDKYHYGSKKYTHCFDCGEPLLSHEKRFGQCDICYDLERRGKLYTSSTTAVSFSITSGNGITDQDDEFEDDMPHKVGDYTPHNVRCVDCEGTFSLDDIRINGLCRDCNSTNPKGRERCINCELLITGSVYTSAMHDTYCMDCANELMD